MKPAFLPPLARTERDLAVTPLRQDFYVEAVRQFRVTLKSAYYAGAYGNAAAQAVGSDFINLYLMGGEL